MKGNRKITVFMFVSALSLTLTACAGQPAQAPETPSATPAQTPRPAAVAPRTAEPSDTVDLIDMGG
ncbi:MAG: hypothetical protein FWG32_02925, partial [Oscillospiraceae bacterium]|nr:hypothetical protein [Oscillospiraceae bacterium]